MKCAGKRTHPLKWLAIALTTCVVISFTPVEATPAHQMCRLDRLSQCNLSSHWQQALKSLVPGRWQQAAKTIVAGQGGVTLLTADQALIILNPEVLKRNHLVLLDETLYEQQSLRNFRSTYYHEVGHVATQHSSWLLKLQQNDWPPLWEHEVLADLYLYWHLLREGADEQELWAQLHLRNIALMQANPDWAHWTTPVLFPLLQDYQQLKLWSLWPLEQFINAALTDNQQWPLHAYRRLGQRQFALTASAINQPYLSAPHRQQWRQMLTPTLEWLGVDVDSYLARHQL